MCVLLLLLFRFDKSIKVAKFNAVIALQNLVLVHLILSCARRAARALALYKRYFYVNR